MKPFSEGEPGSLGIGICYLKFQGSGQISIIPKPVLRGFWGDSLTKPPFKVTSAEVVIICPEGYHFDNQIPPKCPRDPGIPNDGQRAPWDSARSVFDFGPFFKDVFRPVDPCGKISIDVFKVDPCLFIVHNMSPTIQWYTVSNNPDSKLSEFGDSVTCDVGSFPFTRDF